MQKNQKYIEPYRIAEKAQVLSGMVMEPVTFVVTDISQILLWKIVSQQWSAFMENYGPWLTKFHSALPHRWRG